MKYVGDEEGLQMKEVNVNVMDKTMCIQGATIVLTIWDVGGFFLSTLIKSFYISNSIYIFF